MYLRRKTTPSGKVLQLLESYRDAEGRPRSRVVASLGNADIAQSDWPMLARVVEGRLRGRSAEMFDWDYSEEMRKWADWIVRQVDQNTAAKRHPEVARDERTLDGVLVD